MRTFLACRIVTLSIPLVACSESVTEAGDPAVLQIFSGDRQRATVLTTLPNQLVVELLDAGGQPVSGATVTFATQTGGSLSPASAVTNAVGQGRTTYTLGQTAGEQTVAASVDGLSPVSFTITADAAAPSQLAVVDGDGQSGVVGTHLPQPITVQLTDPYDNPTAGITVWFGAETGMTAPDSAVTDAAGHAATTWTLGTQTGNQRLITSSQGLADTALATAASGPPAIVMVVSGDGQSGTRGTTLLQPLVVQVTDAYGNPTAAVLVAFTASHGGAVTPGSAETDASGHATTQWTLGMPLGDQTATATVTNLGSETATATASVPLTLLDHVALDAVYDRVNGRLLTVSADPNRLNFVDPATGASTSIALDLVPAAVSVQPDGAFAAVGHNGFITYVDLTTEAIVKVYGVTADVIDLELPGNGWVYAFPRIDQWETIRSIELATGNETTTGTIRAGTLVRLHPSRDFIYGANNGLSPSDFEKYDIRGGAAAFMYDSPYHGDYAFSGNVWIYDDGTRLIALSGNVFASSSVQTQDMLYVGNLPGASPIASADHSSALQRVLVTRLSNFFNQQPVSELRSYTANFLAFQGSVALPPYIEMDAGSSTAFPSEGRFVFVDATGARVFVLLRGAEPYTGRFNTGLAVFEAADIP